MAAAVPLVAAFPELAVAIAVMLLLWAAGVLLAKPLTWALQQIPVVGGAAAGFVENAVSATTGWAVSWAEGTIGALGQLIMAPLNGAASLIASLVYGIEAVAGMAGTTVQVVERGLGSFADRISSLVGQVANLGTIVGALTTAENALRLSVAAITGAAIPAAIATAIRAAESYTESQVNAVHRVLSAAIAAAAGTAAEAVRAEESARAAADRAIAASAAAGIAEAERLASSAAAGVAQLENVGIPALEHELAGVPTIVQTLIASGVGLELTQLLTRVETLTTECIAPTCNVMKPQLSTLEALMDGAAIAAFLAFVGEAVANPRGTAQVVAGASAELGGLAGSLASLVGVHE